MRIAKLSPWKSTAERRTYFPTKRTRPNGTKEVYCGETNVLPNCFRYATRRARSLLRRDERTSQLCVAALKYALKSTAERRTYFPTLSYTKPVLFEVYCGETNVLPNFWRNPTTTPGSLLRRDERTSQQHVARCPPAKKSTAERRTYFPTSPTRHRLIIEVYCGETNVLPNLPVGLH